MSVSTDLPSYQSDQSLRPALGQYTDFTTTKAKPKHLRKVYDVCDGCLTEETLKSICKTDRLAQVTSLEIKIDARNVSCTDLGALLPNLRQLRLSNSLIPSLKLIGNDLQELEVLWMSRCSLTCLDGLTNLKNLTEIYLAFNEISDLSPCASIESIEVLDLEGNLLSEIKNITFLKKCTRLKSLSLEGNPVVTKLGGIKKYRRFVRKELSQLSMLDDYPVENANPNRLVNFNITHLDDDWSYINALLNEIGFNVNQSRIESCRKSKPEDNKSRKYYQKNSPDLRCFVRGLRSVSALNRFTTEHSDVGLLSDNQRHLEANLLPKASTTSSGAESEDSSEPEEILSRPTTGLVGCGDTSSALHKRCDSSRTTNPDSAAPEQKDSAASDQETVVDADEVLFLANTKDTLTVAKRSPKTGAQEVKEFQQLKQVAGAIDATSILDEEDALQLECAAVLEELATWRKNNVKDLVQESVVNETQALNDCHLSDDNDVILISTDSEDTVKDEDSEGHQTEPVIDSEITVNESPLSDTKDGAGVNRLSSSHGSEDTMDAKDAGDSSTPGPAIKNGLFPTTSEARRPCSSTQIPNVCWMRSEQKLDFLSSRWIRPTRKKASLNSDGPKTGILPSDPLPAQASLIRSRISQPSRSLRNPTLQQPLRLFPSGVTDTGNQSTSSHSTPNRLERMNWSICRKEKVSPLFKLTRNESAGASVSKRDGEQTQHVGPRSAQPHLSPKLWASTWNAKSRISSDVPTHSAYLTHRPQ